MSRRAEFWGWLLLAAGIGTGICTTLFDRAGGALGGSLAGVLVFVGTFLLTAYYTRTRRL
jgi:hypothetical protein